MPTPERHRDGYNPADRDDAEYDRLTNMPDTEEQAENDHYASRNYR